MEIKWIILIFVFCSLSHASSPDSTAFYVDSAVFETEKGSIIITFFENDAPIHAKNLKKLVATGFYNGKIFHRVIKNFIIQTGRTDRKDMKLLSPEIKKIHFRGAVGMARKDDKVNPELRSDPTEFYISLKPKPELDGKYTVFGRVAEGMKIVDEISMMPTDENDKPMHPVKIIRAYINRYFDVEKYNYYKNHNGKKR